MTFKNHLFSIKVHSTVEWTRKTMKCIHMCFNLFTRNILEVIIFSLVAFISININHHCIECPEKTTRLVESAVYPVS